MNDFIKPPKSSNFNLDIKDNTRYSIGFVLDSISNVFNGLKKPVIVALFASAVLLLYNPKSTFALSGGVMGGDSFCDSSSSSSSSFDGPDSCINSSSSSSSRPASKSDVLFVVGFIIAFVALCFILSQTSVIEFQIGLSGTSRSLQSELNRIAYSAETSTSKGHHYILTETMQALLRHTDYCISAHSVIKKDVIEETQAIFNQMSINERRKFDKETLFNVNNVKKQSTESIRPSDSSNEYIVVTVLLVVNGLFSLPTINSSLDLKKAMQKLGSIPNSRLTAVQVLWTPQKENDTLSKERYLEDYPSLKPL